MLWPHLSFFRIYPADTFWTPSTHVNVWYGTALVSIHLSGDENLLSWFRCLLSFLICSVSASKNANRSSLVYHCNIKCSLHPLTTLYSWTICTYTVLEISNYSNYCNWKQFYTWLITSFLSPFITWAHNGDKNQLYIVIQYYPFDIKNICYLKWCILFCRQFYI